MSRNHARNPVGGSKPKTPPDGAQKKFTDPESRIMKGADGFVQAFNAQAPVDAHSQVIVAEKVTQTASDPTGWIPMLEQIGAHHGRQARELSADAGYFSEDNLKELSRRHIRGYVPPGKLKHGDGSPGTGRRKLKQ